MNERNRTGRDYVDFSVLYDWVDKAARQCLDVVVDQSFGAEWRSYKVGGRAFILVPSDPTREASVIVKMDPIRSEVLRMQHPEMKAGGHRLSRTHWVSIFPGQSITPDLIENEVREAYRLVRDALPRSIRVSHGQVLGKDRLAQDQIQPLARRIAASLPDVSHGRPFVEKLDVYKVGDKVFLIVTDDPNERIITLKADPKQAQALCERFETITAGRYFDKHHWISVSAGRGITWQLVTELIETSYLLVVATMPEHERRKKVACE